MAWFVLSCEEQEVKHSGTSVYLSLLGFVSPFRMSRESRVLYSSLLACRLLSVQELWTGMASGAGSL